MGRGLFTVYLEAPGVASDSLVVTFAGVRLHIVSWRWVGVPFYIRAGKNLPAHVTEVVVRLRRPPLDVFGENLKDGTNYVRFRLSPDVTIAMGSRSKAPGEGMVGNQVELLACDSTKDEMSPYERLIGDAMDGDETLFTRADSVDVAWQIVQPILKKTVPVQPYEPGTWGPKEAQHAFGPPHGWINPAS
jgi:glucose-6-phosphate 1-dehydrogenase